MRYCKRCVQPDTRPGIVFDDTGICLACRNTEQRDTKIDWDRREQELQQIVFDAKEEHAPFDCVIGVSGGKDSTFQAFYARDSLRLRPLLVNCALDNITEVGKVNLENLVQHGFDLISIRPNPRVMRELTKKSFFEYGNPVKPSEYPLYASSWIIAVGMNIPLIIQGENPAHTLGITESLAAGSDAFNIRNHNTISGGVDKWVTDTISLRDLYFYRFPEPWELEGKRSIFLEYYAKEWSRKNNTAFAIAHGLQGRFGHDPNLTGRLNKYGSVDSDMQIVNQMLKYYKFGFGFVTDEVCYSIRDGDITRERAIGLVNLYDGKCTREYILEFCDYIDITEKEFWLVTDHWVNKGLFEKENDEWKPKFKVH